MKTFRIAGILLAALGGPGALFAQTPDREVPADTLTLGPADTTAWTPQDHPTLEIRRAPGPIEVDGSLDDAGWANAARATGFAENYPDIRARPPVESEVLVTYDDQNLYLGFIAHDDPAALRTRISDRDQIWSDDYFGILLDTYG
ncbi:MAG TPA: hypothetical protein VFH69_05465, partial [Gemmatimonadota bacterium]|nr:hypothetical protein [Gemmatimonadota bacterium]